MRTTERLSDALSEGHHVVFSWMGRTGQTFSNLKLLRNKISSYMLNPISFTARKNCRKLSISVSESLEFCSLGSETLTSQSSTSSAHP